MSRVAESTGDFDAVSCVLDAFHVGKPALIHGSDDREDEIDPVYPVGTAGSTDVVRVRDDADGLVYITLPNNVPGSPGLPFMGDVLDHLAASSYNLAYDS